MFRVAGPHSPAIHPILQSLNELEQSVALLPYQFSPRAYG